MLAEGFEPPATAGHYATGSTPELYEQTLTDHSARDKSPKPKEVGELTYRLRDRDSLGSTNGAYQG
jgi:hypothetical protein